MNCLPFPAVQSCCVASLPADFVRWIAVQRSESSACCTGSSCWNLQNPLSLPIPRSANAVPTKRYHLLFYWNCFHFNKHLGCFLNLNLRQAGSFLDSWSFEFPLLYPFLLFAPAQASLCQLSRQWGLANFWRPLRATRFLWKSCYRREVTNRRQQLVTVWRHHFFSFSRKYSTKTIFILYNCAKK